MCGHHKRHTNTHRSVITMESGKRTKMKIRNQLRENVDQNHDATNGAVRSMWCAICPKYSLRTLDSVVPSIVTTKLGGRTLSIRKKKKKKKNTNFIQFLFSIIYCFVGIINVTRLLFNIMMHVLRGESFRCR